MLRVKNKYLGKTIQNGSFQIKLSKELSQLDMSNIKNNILPECIETVKTPVKTPNDTIVEPSK